MPHGNSKASGGAGEESARRFAEALGFRTIARNVRTPYGEIDLVLEDPDRATIVVAEVKARSSVAFGGGAEAVTARKRERLRRAAVACTRALGREASPLRFDVFAVSAKTGAVEHYRDAF